MEFCPDMKECEKIAVLFEEDIEENAYAEKIKGICSKCQEEEKNG